MIDALNRFCISGKIKTEYSIYDPVWYFRRTQAGSCRLHQACIGTLQDDWFLFGNKQNVKLEKCTPVLKMY